MTGGGGRGDTGSRGGGEKESPRLSARGLEEAARRRRRLAQALRENLGKRKAQRRGRDAVRNRPQKG